MTYEVGGWAAALSGFRQGREDAQARQDREQARREHLEDRARQIKDREHQDSQRAHQQLQQKRQQDDWQRDDQLRTDISAVPTTREINLPLPVANDDDGNAMPAAKKTVANPVYAQLRGQAEAFRKRGDLDTYLKLHKQADELQSRVAANKVVQLESMAAGKSALEFAQMAKEIIDEDPLPHRIRSVGSDGAAGAVVEIEREGGQVNTYTFKTPEEILKALYSLYNPKVVEQLAIKRAEAAAKAEEKAAEPRVLKPGDHLVQPRPDGSTRVLASHPDAKAGSKDVAGKLIADTLGKDNAGLLAQANQNKEAVLRAHPGLDPATAANIAVDSVTNPEAVQVRLADPRTGRIGYVYRNPQKFQGEIDLGTAPGDIDKVKESFGKNGDAAMKTFAQAMLEAQPPAMREALEKAASDAKALKQYLDQIQGSGKPGADQAAAEFMRKVELLRASGVSGEKSGLSKVVDGLAKAAGFGMKPKSPSSLPAGMAPDAAAAPRRLSDFVGGDRVAQAQQVAASKSDTESFRQAAKPKAAEEAQRLLSNQHTSRKELSDFQRSPYFDLLDFDTKVKIHNRLNATR